ncbi:hypothetical protein HB025_004681 [Salmonella enterica subsp. enterica serovar Weltevreden]|nr:hypothetical protein [Salmonella enterica subsp. enterica serovar Weltevreden]
MKRLSVALISVLVLSGCADIHAMSDYELCQTMSGQTFNASQSGDAAREMQSRGEQGKATLSPEQCSQIAQNTAAQWQQNAANLTAASNAYNQQLQQQEAAAAASRPISTTCNPTINGGMQCSTF